MCRDLEINAARMIKVDEDLVGVVVAGFVALFRLIFHKYSQQLNFIQLR